MKEIIKKYKLKSLFIGVFILLAIFIFLFNFNLEFKLKNDKNLKQISIDTTSKTLPKYKFGFCIDSFTLLQNEIRKDDIFHNLVGKYGVSYEKINQFKDKKFQDKFNINKLKIGQEYFLFLTLDSGKLEKIVFKESERDYFIFEFNTPNIKKFEYKMDTILKSVGGVINNSLYEKIEELGINQEITYHLSEILAFDVDFYHLYKGDYFKVVYDEININGKFFQFGDIHSVQFYHQNKLVTAIKLLEDGKVKYYDLEGKALQGTFLKSPVKYSRISSKYNLKRAHPILKIIRPHFGIDYAAPYGTPVRSIGSGIVIEKGYKSGNGNYIKIKHTSIYKSQYLHLNSFSKNISIGSKVDQGQIIGYVGSTGLATGPHLCFRFWKNDKQINYLTQSFESIKKTVPTELLEEFMLNLKKQLQILNKISLDNELDTSNIKNENNI